MLRKIYGGTARSDEKSLCSNCRFATIVRGQTLDEEVVHCQSVTTRGMRVTFKVTSCTSHSDIDQPTYMQLLEDAWILKIALSIPDDLFASGEALAKRLGVSRSGLYASALQDFVAKHRSKSVTERLNAVYAAHDGTPDEALREIQARSLEKNTW